MKLVDATDTKICRAMMLTVMASMTDWEFDVYNDSDMPIFRTLAP